MSTYTFMRAIDTPDFDLMLHRTLLEEAVFRIEGEIRTSCASEAGGVTGSGLRRSWVLLVPVFALLLTGEEDSNDDDDKQAQGIGNPFEDAIFSAQQALQHQIERAFRVLELMFIVSSTSRSEH